MPNSNGESPSIKIDAIGIVQADRVEVIDDDWGGSVSKIVLSERFPQDALQGIETFSHAEVLFYFNQVREEKIVEGARHPRNNADWPAVGIFAQRGKNRPNRIGSTICRVVGREGNVLTVSELDAIDGTPVLDIKPVLKEFLPRGEVSQPAWSSELMRSYWNPVDGSS